MKVRVHIERLVLEGLPVGKEHARHLRAAVETELARLIERRGLSHEARQGVSVPRIQGPQARASRNPRGTGVEIARSIYAGIGRPK
jgi:hypothetical protein